MQASQEQEMTNCVPNWTGSNKQLGSWHLIRPPQVGKTPVNCVPDETAQKVRRSPGTSEQASFSILSEKESPMEEWRNKRLAIGLCFGRMTEIVWILVFLGAAGDKGIKRDWEWDYLDCKSVGVRIYLVNCKWDLDMLSLQMILTNLIWTVRKIVFF